VAPNVAGSIPVSHPTSKNSYKNPYFDTMLQVRSRFRPKVCG